MDSCVLYGGQRIWVFVNVFSDWFSLHLGHTIFCLKILKLILGAHKFRGFFTKLACVKKLNFVNVQKRFFRAFPFDDGISTVTSRNSVKLAALLRTHCFLDSKSSLLDYLLPHVLLPACKVEAHLTLFNCIFQPNFHKMLPRNFANFHGLFFVESSGWLTNIIFSFDDDSVSPACWHCDKGEYISDRAIW